jgi:hypothetical protein
MEKKRIGRAPTEREGGNEKKEFIRKNVGLNGNILLLSTLFLIIKTI